MFGTSTLPLAKYYSEKYEKRLNERTDLEDAVKRRDKLTQDEAWMATAEVLRFGHIIDESARVVREL